MVMPNATNTVGLTLRGALGTNLKYHKFAGLSIADSVFRWLLAAKLLIRFENIRDMQKL